LFVNHGANHHIGWARLHVKLARHFANIGIDSLRMDISGVGDSPAHPSYAENLLYARHSQLDVYAALDWIKNAGYETITLIGHCSGAHLGFYSTLRDARINNLVMLNMQRFFWARDDSLRTVSRENFHSNQWYFRKLHEREVWGRLFKARVDIPGILFSLTRRAMQRSYNKTMNILGRWFGREHAGRKVVRWLRELANRQVRVLLVYSAEDGGLDELSAHTGPNARKARRLKNVEMQVIKNADHNMTPSGAQDEYQRILEEFLTRPQTSRVTRHSETDTKSSAAVASNYLRGNINSAGEATAIGAIVNPVTGQICQHGAISVLRWNTPYQGCTTGGGRNHHIETI